MSAEAPEDRLEPSPPTRRRALREMLDHLRPPRVGLRHETIDQRQEDGLLRGEVEVEARAGDARAAGQVIYGDLLRRALLEQPLGRREDRGLPLLAADPRRAPPASSPARRACPRCGLGGCRARAHRLRHYTLAVRLV